jgi:hypothetical protein
MKEMMLVLLGEEGVVGLIVDEVLRVHLGITLNFSQKMRIHISPPLAALLL